MSRQHHAGSPVREGGEDVTLMGLENFQSDWFARRASKNIVAEIGESVGRLPESYTKTFPGINWALPAGTRNRTQTNEYVGDSAQTLET